MLFEKNQAKISFLRETGQTSETVELIAIKNTREKHQKHDTFFFQPKRKHNEPADYRLVASFTEKCFVATIRRVKHPFVSIDYS